MKNLSSRKSLVLLAVIVLNIVNALVGILGNVVSKDIESVLVRAGISQYLIQITVGLVIVGLLVAAWVFKAEKDVAKDDISKHTLPESERATREFLADLAIRYQKRNTRKLDGRYEISLVVSDDVEGTQTRHFDEEFGADAPAGKAAQYIVERFERQRRLLIVGSPGSGKTVLLVTLAQYLAEKALKDASQPLPVIFNLDSWSSDYGRFDDWLKAMLTKGYGLSPVSSSQLLGEQRIVFLLDGLDELARNEEPDRAAAVRAECLAGLDEFLYDGMMNVVICCRREQFASMLRQTGANPPVAAVVAVQDLTPVQVDRALIRASATPRDNFAARHLLAALGQDRNGVYEQVLSTPFYFTTALQVFDSTKSPFIEAPDKETLESNLIAAFIEKKLKVTQNARRFSVRQTYAWLTWLAAFLNSRERVMFELADLQPSTLRRDWLYRVLFSVLVGVSASSIMSLEGIIAVIFFGVSIGLIGAYLVTENLAQWTLAPLRRRRTWINILWQGLLVGVLCGVLWGLDSIWASDLSKLAPDRNPIVHAVARSIVTVVFSAVIVVITSLIAVIVGAFVRLFVKMLVGILGGMPSDIATEDFAQWTLAPLGCGRTWREAFAHGLSAGLTGGTISFGVSFFTFSAVFLVGDVVVARISIMLLTLIGLSMIGGLLGAAIGGTANVILCALRACRQIRRFAKINSPYQRLMAGLVFNLVQGTVIGMGFVCLILVLMWLAYERHTSLNLSGAILAILAFALLGLFRTSLLKHSVLRACLTLEGAMPLRYADFLNYATEMRILEKDGGQWRFRHQILQDYFARRPKGGGSGLPQT